MYWKAKTYSLYSDWKNNPKNEFLAPKKPKKTGISHFFRRNIGGDMPVNNGDNSLISKCYHSPPFITTSRRRAAILTCFYGKN